MAFQRPQQLMTRLARIMPVYFVEEVAFEGSDPPHVKLFSINENLTVVVPHLPQDFDPAEAAAVQGRLLEELCVERSIHAPILWLYTPMAIRIAGRLPASALVYDCMDELAAFDGASPELRELERRLLNRADLVFAGGPSLYEAKRARHPRVHAFPSAVDFAHFAAAREPMRDPPDQAGLPHPRLGFYGVIDERLDRDLVAAAARLRPEWQFVFLGPVVKIDPATLPRAANIHYLGSKNYRDLPSYIAHWAVALMPFARNRATRFISPTKTPEYLAAGKPVVSTPIVDVVRQWAHLEAVQIAGDPEEFIAKAEQAMALASAEGPAADFSWRETADRALAEISWDRTVAHMLQLVADAITPQPQPDGDPRAAAPAAALPTAPALRRRARFDYLVVGAGFAGSVLAERLAAGSDKRVLVVDRRPHIGGNAYDFYNDSGLLVQRYGPHIFHTNARQVVAYLSGFTTWRPYEHRVRAMLRDRLVPIPINRTTINRVFNLDLRPDQIGDFLARRAEPVCQIETSEDVVVSQVGRELYELFFRGYTRKQWGLDPAQLDKSVTARIPVRTGDDDRYFTDAFQMMPRHGFTRLFENMLDHPNIEIMLEVDYREIIDDIDYDRMVYTGPVDEFFEYRYGKLPYRSLCFRHETLACERFQPVAVVNYPSEEVPYTRITEYKHLTGQRHPKTAISHEFPQAEGDPYYPVPRPANAALYARYRELADALPDIVFVGRLATYRYYNMDQVVAQALATYARLVGGEGRPTQAARMPAPVS